MVLEQIPSWANQASGRLAAEAPAVLLSGHISLSPHRRGEMSGALRGTMYNNFRLPRSPSERLRTCMFGSMGV